MTESRRNETESLWQRADESLRASRELLTDGFADFAASRAYYAAFYACCAALLTKGLEFSKHSATLSAVHLHFVKPGLIAAELGRKLNWLFDLRGIGDYGVMVHVPAADASRAIEAAVEIVDGLRGLR